MDCLRTFLSDAHVRALSGKSLVLDTPVEDVLLEERMLRIRAQIVCALVLRAILGDMGFDMPDELDLLPLIRVAQDQEVLNRREAGVLEVVNTLANQAKHLLHFRSRL